MDHDTRRFAREAKADIKALIEHCESLAGCDPAGLAERDQLECAERDRQAAQREAELFDGETEVMVRAAMGGSANLGFFLPYLWKHRH
jgi:hypothetical protein